jgi:hypothetical protein
MPTYYDVNDSFADLRQDKLQQAAEASAERKCGTCRFFVVRPPEVELARMARPMSRCGPGSQCSGGPVRGMCQKWKVRGAAGPQMESTQVCNLYQPGGPSVLGMSGDGSFQRAVGYEGAYGAAQHAEQAAYRPVSGVLFAVGAVGLLALAKGVQSWMQSRA